jgi:hypothetical protein
VGTKCQAARNNQAICIGGVNPEAPVPLWNNTDEWAQGVNVLDMNKLVWKDRYEANAAAYAAPEIVRREYNAGWVLVPQAALLWLPADAK